MVFILNISSCQPCEDKVNALITSDKWNNLNKTFIITNERAPIIKEKEGFISFERKDLLSYGLLRANGTVLLMKNGKCILIESIDINHIENLEKKITDLLKL